MKSSCDYTKDKKYKSYEQFVYKSLIELGFRVTNVGTIYLKDLVLFTYFNSYYEINVTQIVKDYIEFKGIKKVSSRTFVNCINYAINNIDQIPFKTNFEKIVRIPIDDIYISSKNIIILLLRLFWYNI